MVKLENKLWQRGRGREPNISREVRELVGLREDGKRIPTKKKDLQNA